jgi:hypothetical protein
MTGSEPVRDPVPVVMASGGKITLRVYDGARLEVELPLSRARALLLAHDLLGALLPPREIRATY